MIDYPLYAKKITISFLCPNCHHNIQHEIKCLPTPNWDGETVTTSQEMDSDEFECPVCKKGYEAEMFANIYYAELRVHPIGGGMEINNVDVFEDWEQQDTFETMMHKRSDLDVFLDNNDTDFPAYLNKIVKYACYLSYNTKKSFAIEDLIEDRDDYRYSFMRGLLSAMCAIHSSDSIICQKVISDNFWENKAYYICRTININIYNLVNTNLRSVDLSNIVHYFKNRQVYSSYQNLYNVTELKNGFDLSQTSLNDDILLYSLKYAYCKNMSSIPVEIVTGNTPFYDIVEAYSFAEHLKSTIKNHFSCEFDRKAKFIKNIKMDEYFQTYTRESLIEKYVSNNMYIDGVFDMIEHKIQDCHKQLNK